jgi:hypothetical protein
MSKFVKNKTGWAESVDYVSAHGPNSSAKKELSKKTEIKDLNEDSGAQLRTGQCCYIKPDRSKCEANAVRESFYCFFHDPDLKQEREAARKKGGKERSRKAAVLPSDTPDRPLATAADITALLTATINQVLRGQLDTRISNSVSVLVDSLVRAQRQEQVERRLERLESILAHRWANPQVALERRSESNTFDFVKSPGGNRESM